MSDTEKESIHIKAFNGKHDEWQVWSAKFLARAQRKGYKEILTGDVDVPEDDESFDETTEEGKRKKRLRELNEIGYEALILLIDGETQLGRVAFAIVNGCKTNKFKYGDCAKAWDRLCKKYEPKSAPSRLALRNKFNNMKLTSWKNDPEVWLTELEDIRVHLIAAGSTMSEDDLLEHALNNLPKEYDVVVSLAEKRLGSFSDPLTIDELRDNLNLRFQKLGGTPGETGGKGNGSGRDNAALFAGGFKGKCNSCGRWGHKKINCPDNKDNDNKESGNTQNSNNGRFTGNCFYCKKRGHRLSKCRKKKADQKNKQDTANPAVDESDGIALTSFAIVD